MTLELKATLREIETISREWREFSMEAHGHNTMYYGKGFRVRCYFAEMDYEHSAVTLGCNRVDGIQTIFFPRPEIQGLSTRDCEQIPKLFMEARTLLDIEKKKRRPCADKQRRTACIKEACSQFAEKLVSLIEDE